MNRPSMFAACISAASLVFLAGAGYPNQQPPVTNPAAAAPALLTGAIDAVTVYRGQALVTRVVDVAGTPGLRELVVTDLPEAILAGSLYAESSDGLEVRSVSFRVRPVGRDSREEVRAAEAAMLHAQDAFDAANAKVGFLQWQRAYLDKLESFVAPSAQTELKSGVLNAETLAKLTEMVTSQRRQQTDEGQLLNVELRSMREALELRKRELDVLAASTSRTTREAVIFVNVTRPDAKLRLTYLVNGANWTPSYNLRVGTSAAETAKLEYQASVQQMSGEDWSNVQLTLSTATPALVATGPSLVPLTVALVMPGQGDAAGIAGMLKDKSYADVKRELVAKQRDMEQNRNVFMGRSGGQMAGAASQPQRAEGAVLSMGEAVAPATVLSLDEGLNSVANESQILDLVSSTRVVRKGKDDLVTVRQGNEGVSVSYKVQGRTSMPSRPDQQLIQIATLELPATVHKAATPTLTQYIYNEASVVNASDMVLLAGPASSYVGGEFVGSSGVPTIAAGEAFRAGFGIDTSLRSGKELVERTESTQGGNRIIEFTYKLTVENFGKAAATVRLLDRLPNPKDPGIKLTLLSQTPELSSDKDYLETERKQNLLRWDISVPAGATGTKALSVEYKFKLEFDKQMMVTEGR